MSEALNYSDREWKLLITVPQSVVAELMLANSGRFMRETLVMFEALQLARQQFSGSRLVQAVLDGVERGDTLEGTRSRTGHQPQQQPVEDLLLVQSRQAALLLQEAPQDESEAYRQFVRFLAEHVAAEAEKGSFFGFGTKRSSSGDANLISAVDAALRAS